LNNRTFNMALGHVLGGGSSINAMVWTRGMQRDYDGWAKNGAKGWAFADVLPVFKSQEDWEGGANAWRGAGGPIHIRRPKDPHPTAPAFIDAARQMGMPILDDVNGPMRPGAGYINMNIAADGTRVSAARAFLRPALSRPNLTLLVNTNVVKLNFKGTRCVGVRLMTDGAVKDIAADKEVILAAGTINSPKLLMLSGVGEAKALRSFGIDVVENLPGVGENLQDHVLVSGVVFKYKGKMPDRPADSNAVEAEAYLSSSPSGDTDISLVLHQLPVVTPEVASRFGAPPPDAFTFRGESAFSTWLHRLAVNIVLMRMRKKKINETSLENGACGEEFHEVPREFGARDLALMGSVDRVNLERAVAQLAPGYKQIFLLHDVPRI
jgi:choline dehydrogenase